MTAKYNVRATGYSIVTNIWNEKVPCSYICCDKTFTDYKSAMNYAKELQKECVLWDGIILTTTTKLL